MSICSSIVAIGLHLASYHTHDPSNPQRDGSSYNNVNPGLYVKTECGLTGGVYYNSVRKVTGYVAYTWDSNTLPVFASIGVATGYNRPLTPMGMAGLRVTVRDYRLRLGYIPRLGRRLNDTNVFHLMVERRF